MWNTMNQVGALEIITEKLGTATVVSVSGRIDTISAPEFQKRIEEALAQAQNSLCLDFGQIEYLSSAGLRSILVLANKAKSSDVDFCCCCLQDMVRRVFDLSGFTKMIPVYQTVEESFKKRQL
jgi:anti-anti-sigma factor